MSLQHIRRVPTFCFIFLTLLLFIPRASAQNKGDSLTDELKAKLINNVSHFTFGFYVDTYVTIELDDNKDTSNIVPFFANCPMRDQIRLNVAALEIYYNDEKVRGKLQLQYGDAPNLLAAPEKEWIKTIRQAAIGFRIVKDLWIDAGYMFTPVGCESAWPVTNFVSTASVCGYFEAGAVLGIKVSYRISDKVDIGLMAGDPYSLAYQQTNHLAGVLFINYMPLKNLTLTYSNLFGNQALKNAEIKNNLLYNDVQIAYSPIKNIDILAQCDFAFQSNSRMPPDTNKIASMVSGFIQARYRFLKHFSVTGRYEMFTDPEGFLSGVYNYENKSTGLMMNGCSLGLEYKPVKIGYVRMEYKFLHANPGNKVYYSNTSDHLNALIFTTGVRF
ncbi:MAG: outer membrane beta-barrel protein [Bacteroidetes bacterium]|nr:outer membrane beta-barrel protein [Bacteroidota bacterium]